MRLSALVAAPLFAFVLGACSSDDAPGGAPLPPPCDDLTQEACLTERYFRGYEASKAVPCEGFAPSAQKVGARRELVLFFGGASNDTSVVKQGRYVQRFYDPYDLAFFTRQKAVPAPLMYALNGTSTQVGQLKYDIEKGKPASPEVDAQVAKAINDLIFGELRKFIREHSSPGQKAINVVVLDKIFSPGLKTELDSYQGGDFGTVVGLGLSPALFKNIIANDPSTNLFVDMGLPEDFAPTLLVGEVDLDLLAKKPDVIVSHELGHAMGLEHTSEPGDLMTQGQAGLACAPGLNDRQVEALRSAASVIDATCGWRRLLAFRDSLVRSALARRTP